LLQKKHFIQTDEKWEAMLNVLLMETGRDVENENMKKCSI
jgi:hypothetical protein